MASHFLGGRLQGGRNAFDVPLAALAGLSVAFAAFAAPAELLAELVRSSRLPSLLPAAEPPLGLNARIAIGAAGAVAMFAFAFLLLRWLDRFGRRRAEAAEEEREFDMPRLRRRDFHPDAAPRPPISAAAEFGEPVPQPQPETAVEKEIEIEPEAEPEQPQFLRRSWLPEAPAPAAEEAAPIMPDPPAAEPEVAVARPQQGGSIAELLERLERGLARRRDVPAAPAAVSVSPPANGTPQVFPETDDRLQSAIDSLQRLASRQD